MLLAPSFSFFFFNDTATTEIYTLSLHDALPICGIKIDPNNVILKGSTGLRARAAIARGEDLAEQGRFYDAVGQYQRSEEHTSELQSLAYLVCRLLLEKKNTALRRQHAGGLRGAS